MLAPARSFTCSGMTVHVWPDAESVCRFAADWLARTIHEAEGRRGRAVLGLATGSTPERAYTHLVERHRAGKLSFRQVTTYNLDEYYPISPLDPLSYRAYMHRHLFSKVDLPFNQAHVLDGSVPEAFAPAHAAEFDRWIENDGGLDGQLLGIGRNGHIGFNEPSELDAEIACRLPTRLVELHPTTRADAAREFGSIDRAPSRALTMGTAPVLAARSLLVLATGPRKAEIVAKALEGPMTAATPASLLQTVAPRAVWALDAPAARLLAPADR